ncbi:MTCP1 domain-containing protein [Cenococcum geophilum]
MAAEEPETPWNDAAAAKFEGKQFSQYFDPCQEAAARSLRCLHRNGGDREMCSDFFQAYRDCKKQWVRPRKEEKRKKGISLW